MKCALCEDCGWVCESHPDKPWDGDDACGCGGAGMPLRPGFFCCDAAAPYRATRNWLSEVPIVLKVVTI